MSVKSRDHIDSASNELAAPYHLPIANRVVLVVAPFFAVGGVLTALFVFPQGSLLFWFFIGEGSFSFVVFSSVVIGSCIQWRQVKKTLTIQEQTPAFQSNLRHSHIIENPEENEGSRPHSTSINEVNQDPDLNQVEQPPTTSLITTTNDIQNSEQLTSQPFSQETPHSPSLPASESHVDHVGPSVLNIVVSPPLQNETSNSPSNPSPDVAIHSFENQNEGAPITIKDKNDQATTTSVLTTVLNVKTEELPKATTLPQTTTKEIKKITIEPLQYQAPSMATTLLNNISNYLLSGGNIQKRAYLCLLAPILEAIFVFLSDGKEKYESISQKELSERAVELINKGPDTYKFLVNKSETDLKDLELCLWKCFNFLITVTTENASTNRKQFNEWLEKAQETQAFKENAEAYNKALQTQSPFEIKQTYPLQALITAMANAMFTKVHLHTLADDAVFQILQKGYGKRVSHWKENVNLKEALEADFQAIHHAPTQEKSGGRLFTLFNKLKGHLNIWFNPVNTNNYISVLWKDIYMINDQEQIVECLRFGTPTKEEFNNPVIIAQLHYFLQNCVAKKEVFVSFQHQNFKEKGLLKGNEAHRLQKMVALNEDKNYSDYVYVFCLPMDNDFFNQKGKYKNLSDINLFKANLFTVITNSGEGFLIPKQKLEQKKLNYLIDIKDIIETVHKTFFPKAVNKKEKENDPQILSQEERVIFQLITYLYLEDYFVTALGARYFHSQCKDAQDRAMVILALQFYMRMIKMGLEKDPDKLRELRVLVHHAALFIKGDAIHGERGQLLLSVLNFLQTHLEAHQKKAIRNTPITHTVANQPRSCTLKKSFIEWMPNQSIQSMPSEATNVKEYRKSISSDLNKEHYFPISDFSSILKKQETDFEILQQFFHDIERQEFLINDQRPTLELKAHNAHLSYKKLFEIYLTHHFKQYSEMTKDIEDTLFIYADSSLTKDDFTTTVKNTFSEHKVEISETKIKELAEILFKNPYKGKANITITSFKSELEKLNYSSSFIKELQEAYQANGDVHHKFSAALNDGLKKEITARLERDKVVKANVSKDNSVSIDIEAHEKYHSTKSSFSQTLSLILEKQNKDALTEKVKSLCFNLKVTQQTLVKLGLSAETAEEIYNAYQAFSQVFKEYEEKFATILDVEKVAIKQIITHLKANEFYSYIYENTGKSEPETYKLLAYCDQRNTTNMTAVMYQRYNANIENADMKVIQRKLDATNTRPNTLSNVKFKNNQAHVEIRQMWEIYSMDNIEKPLYSLRSRLDLDHTKDFAVMSWIFDENENLELFEKLDEDSFMEIRSNSIINSY